MVLTESCCDAVFSSESSQIALKVSMTGAMHGVHYPRYNALSEAIFTASL